ncbi:alpha-L-arabinofuranosidase [Chitinophagaceae bacterium 26-R-25]|nr:alpha-L-arabinofuranosidase [Chitinophagaceae bacterium 26-R-25]
MTKTFSGKLALCASILFLSCKKDSSGGGGNPPPTPPTDTVVTEVINPQVDPSLASTIGIFMNDWKAKTFAAPTYKDTTIITSNPSTVTVDFANVITKISPSIFGNNANSWMTGIVSQSALMTHLSNLKTNIVRFPGGSISDIYFWNAPVNKFPADAPATLVDASGKSAASGYWTGQNQDDWTISVDKYYQLLQQTGSQGIITVNYGYARYGTSNNPVAAAAHMAADWVRYDNGRTKYWEVGNECYGDWEAGYRIDQSTNKDGQSLLNTGYLYGQHFKVFADSMRKAAQEIGKTIYIGAVVMEAAPASYMGDTQKNWNSGVMGNTGTVADYYIVHNYFTPYNTNSTAKAIMDSASSVTSNMMNYITSNMTSNGVATKPVALTEWNIFSQGSQQAVSNINGLHALILLNEAIKNKYAMTSRWDLANGWSNGDDHGLFNIGDEPGASKWEPRPAFYYMYFFQKFLGDRMISAGNSNSNILTYASSFTSGQMSVTIVNKSTSEQQVEIATKNFKKGERYYWYSLQGGSDNGEFSRKVYVNGNGSSGVSGGPASYNTLQAYSSATAGGIKVKVPARGAVVLVVDTK